METKDNKTVHLTYFQKAARTFYFVAVVAFTISLAFSQLENFRNVRLGLILIDSVSLSLIFFALLLYIKKIISLQLNSAVYVYATLVNLVISAWYYFDQNIHFTENFLFGTFMYCINIVVAGFCIGRKHLYIAAGLYIVNFGPLIYISRDNFLINNALIVLFLILAFSFGISGFLFVLEKSHKEELGLKEAIFEKDKAISHEQNKFLRFELETKQKEIMAKTMFLLEYAENNNIFIKKLNCLKKRMKSSEQRLLNNIIQKHRIEHREKYWKEFEISYLETQPEFYKKLNHICPELSPSELKLVAFVNLGLSSKQIGNITSTTPESVDVARSRLRSKLNLPSEANLTTFLHNL